jgi:hypothetical protein
MTVWAVESVYWTQIPDVKTFQAMHWNNFFQSKPVRLFWILFGVIAAYQTLPTYIFPWLSAVSIPCLAAMASTGKTGQTLTNLFGGSMPNEGLGLLSISLSWTSIGSGSISMPLKLQSNMLIGILLGYATTLAVYYGNAWNALRYPFQATSLRRDDGTRYSSTKVFDNGILNHEKLAAYGLPHLAGTYAWGMVLANAAVSRTPVVNPHAPARRPVRACPHLLAKGHCAHSQDLAQDQRRGPAPRRDAKVSRGTHVVVHGHHGVFVHMRHRMHGHPGHPAAVVGVHRCTAAWECCCAICE